MKQKAAQLAARWETWTVLILALVAWVIYRNGRRWWQQLTRRDEGNYQGQAPVASNPVREAELTKIAQDTYTALNSVLMIGGVTATGREWQLTQVLTLNDTELRWVAKRYEQLANGSTLRRDLENEWMPFSDVDDRLIARLNQLAL